MGDTLPTMACMSIARGEYFIRTYRRGRLWQRDIAELPLRKLWPRLESEIARRGLAVTVTKDFYGLVVAQRKYATAQLAVEQAKHFFDITQDGERAGQSPHSDVIKAEIQYRLQQQTFDESKLAMEDARLTLGRINVSNFE